MDYKNIHKNRHLAEKTIDHSNDKRDLTDRVIEAFWQKQANQSESAPSYLVYGGIENQKRSHADVFSWRSAGDLIKKLD